MKAKVEFYEIRNGERYYFAYTDFMPNSFNFTTKSGITRGYRKVIEKCRRTLYMTFGCKTIDSEAYMYDENGKKIGDTPIATAKVQLYF